MNIKWVKSIWKLNELKTNNKKAQEALLVV